MEIKRDLYLKKIINRMHNGMIKVITGIRRSGKSAFSLPDDEKRAQEKASLMNVHDSFKKIIIVKDVIKPLYDDDGILTMSIYDFLLNEHSLDI